MENKNDRLKGIITAMLVMLLLLIMSIFLGFYYPDPPIPDLGVEIEMGGSGSSGGAEGQQTIPEPEPRAQSVSTPISRSYVTDSRSDNSYSAPTTTPVTKPREESKVVQPEAPKKNVNPNAMFKKGTSGTQGSGTSSGTGVGTGTGTTPGDGTGKGVGSKSGPSFSLTGRTAKDLPKPSYTSDNQGVIVIVVKVDQEGNVIDAQFTTAGSTTSDRQLINAAIAAAKKSRFSVKLDAAVIQKGTITYDFIKLN